MRDIRDGLDLRDTRTAGKGFVSEGIHLGIVLHRADCIKIDPLYSSPDKLKFFDTKQEAEQWLSEHHRSHWSSCDTCILPLCPSSPLC